MYGNDHDKLRYVVPWCKLYRTDLFSDIQYPEGKIFEDIYTTHHLIFVSSRIAVLNQKLWYYYQHDSSIMNQPFHIGKLDYLDALGIRQPPEILWGYSLEWDPDARYLLHERNAFLYPDEQRRVMLTVYLLPIPEHAPDDGEIYIYHSEEGQTADFIVGNAQVTLIGNGMEAGDIMTLKDIAQELKSSLEK